VRRNVATLVDTPAGQEGRPSKSLTFGQLTVRSIGNAYRSQARSSRDDFSAAVCACPSCPASRAVVHAGPGWLADWLAGWLAAGVHRRNRSCRVRIRGPTAASRPVGQPTTPGPHAAAGIRPTRGSTPMAVPADKLPSRVRDLAKRIALCSNRESCNNGLRTVPDGEIASVDESRPGWTTCRAAVLNSWPERRAVHDAEARGSRA
jgi:hypothetical protein